MFNWLIKITFDLLKDNKVVLELI